MEYRVLGKLEVRRGGESVDFGAFRQRSLLALLLTAPNTVFSTDRIIDALWGDEGGTDKQNALWVYVSGLRKALEPERVKRSEGSILLTRSPGYLLEVDADSVDALRFERMIGEGRVLAGTDPGAASLVLGEALALWRGRAYEEFTYESFAQAEIARLSELRTEAIEARIDADLARGMSRALVSELEALVRQYPLQERFTAQLMLALYRSGRQAEALRAFGLLKSRLGEELGIEPSGRLRQLNDQIVTGDLEAGAQTEVTAHGPAPRLSVRGYELREQIGEGAFGIVHRAYQPAVGREVAVKVIRPELANDPQFIRRFEAEAQLVARLEHPHIVPLYDYWREPDAAYLVMRLMRGGNLGDVLEQRGLTPAEAVRTATQLGGALVTAHRAGVIHRDIKPANILLDDDGNAYLSDFGIAVGDDGGTSGVLSASSTPPYASPEQLADGPVTPSSDIYSLGVVLAQALTGLAGRVEEIRGALPAGALQVIDRATAGDGRYEHVGSLVADLSEALGTDAASDVADDTDLENPYKGLRAFDAADESDFFGRGRLVDRLVARVGELGTRGRFVGLVGPSGSGKSSAVKAGLIPALRRGALPGSDTWYVVEMTPAPYPFEQLEDALLTIVVDPPPSLLEVLAGSDDGIRRAIRRVMPRDGSQLLIVIDQFEELFTQVDETTTRRFLATLVDAINDPHSGVRVLITLRADFYDLPLRHRGLGELLRDGTEVITPMTPDELASAITGPVERLGVTFEPAVVAELVRDVVDRAGSLPLLQYTLTELFEARQGRRVTSEAYHELGGVSGVLAKRAEGLLTHLGDEAHDITRQVFLRLVTLGEGADDTRRRVRRNELEQLDVDRRTLDDVLDTFGRHRLLGFDRDPVTRGPTVEISHEALLTEWDRLRGWIDGARDDVRNQRRLAAAATEWTAAGRSADHLLTGGALDRLAGWASESSVTLGAVEREFLAESIAAKERLVREEEAREAHREAAEASARRRLRVTVGAVAVAALVGALAVVAFLQARAAEQSEDELAATLRSQDLAAASVLQLQTDLDLAAAFALASAHATSDFGVITPEAMDALHWVIQASNLTYPASDETPVAVRPGPRGATGVYYLPPDELAALAQSVVAAPFNTEQCAEFFPTEACPDPRETLPDSTELQGGEEAYGVVSQGPGALAGTRVEVLHAVEEDPGFLRELERFEQDTGIVISSPTQAAPEFELQRRPADLEPDPDIVFWPQPALIAGQPADSLIDLSAYLGVDQLRRDMGSRLVSLGTVGTDGTWPAGEGALVGLPIDVDVKGLVFYPRQKFEEAGYQVPASWNDLVQLSNQIVADGGTPWCFHFASGLGSGWPGTDLIETMVAREGGVELYDEWTRHDIPFDHPVVDTAANKVEQLLLTDEYARGGSASISRFEVFTEGLTPLLQDQPACWLYHQADFMMTLAPAEAAIGRDIDAFPFPPLEAGQPLPALGGGSLLSALGDRPEVRAFITSAASPTWGEQWASPQASSFISPNARFDVAAYASDVEAEERTFSRTLGTLARDAIAANLWRFDASDLMPGPIGSISDGTPGAFWVGMLDVVDGRRTMGQVLVDIEAEWQRLDAE